MMKSRTQILDKLSLIDLENEVNRWVSLLNYYDDCDDDDNWDYYFDNDDDYDYDIVRSEYITKRNGVPKKIKVIVGKKVDLLSIYSTSILRQKKLESLLDGKHLESKNYFENFLDEKSKTALYDFYERVSAY